MTLGVICGLLAVLSFQLAAAQIIDWCGLESCGTREHITCKYPGTESGDYCGNFTFNMLDLRAVQPQMLDKINKYRAKYANGQVAGYPKAECMGEVGWNVTFANMARRNVRQCESKHDGCRNTPDFDYCGQNIGWSTFKVNQDKRSNIQIILDIVDWWMRQERFYTPDFLKSYVHKVGPERYHYGAQLLKDQSTRIGCAALSKILKNDTNIRTILITCNFDLGLAQAQPVYLPAKGNTAGAGCLTGPNSAYPGLCSASEEYDVNDYKPRYE